MSVAGNLVINLMGNTQHLNRALTRSASRIRAFSATSQRSLTAFGTTSAATFAAIGAGAAKARSAIGNVALALSGGLGLGTGFAFRNLVKFDDAIRAAGARARTTAAGIEILRNRARELGRTSSFTQTQVAEMMEGLTKGGFSVPQVVGGMTKAVMDLTRAAGTDGAMAARLLGDSIGVFNIKAADSSKVASVLSGVLNRTRMDADDLADGFKFAAKTGADLGMSFSDTIAVMGTLAQAGLRGSLAGTAIRKIGQITVSEATKIRKEFGITFKETQNGTVNVIENFEILSKAMQGLSRTDRLSKFFETFGIRGAQAASSLADSAVSTRALADELKRVFDEGTEAAETAAAMDAGIGGALRRLLSAAEELGDAWATRLKDPVIKAMDEIREKVTETSKWIRKERGGMGDFLEDAGAVTSAGLTMADVVAERGPDIAEKLWDHISNMWNPENFSVGPGKLSGQIDDFFGYSKGRELARRETNAVLEAPLELRDSIAEGVINGMKGLYGLLPSLPRPGLFGNLPPGYKIPLTAQEKKARDTEREDVRKRFAKVDAETARREAARDRGFVGPVQSNAMRSEKALMNAVRGAIRLFVGKNQTTQQVLAEDAAQRRTAGNELADRFKGITPAQEKQRMEAQALAAQKASNKVGSRSGAVFGLQDAIRTMERQGASKQDIRRMENAQKRLAIATEKANRLKEKTIRVEIAPPE